MKNPSLLFLGLISIFFLSACKGEFLSPAKKISTCCDIPALEESIGNGAFFVPNIFTPDQDGVNDYFSVWCDPNIESIVSLQIFNKRNRLVFEAEEMTPNIPTEGWDGTIDGEVERGVFAFQVTVKAQDGTQETYSGEVCCFPCRSGDPIEPKFANFEQCHTPSQHNGLGGYEPTQSHGEFWGCLED